MKISKVTNDIKRLRLMSCGMSQQKLADLVGCTRQTIIALEQNKYSPSYLLVAKVASVFKIKTNEVISVEFSN